MNFNYNIVIDRFIGQHAVLSNFFPASVEFEGITYPSVEHAFQAAKTFNENTRMLIAQTNDAHVAKKLGRMFGIQRPLWAPVVRFEVMEQLLASKFDQNSYPDMVSNLLDTGDAVLIEGNYWHDNTWGSCNCDKCGRRGSNALGRMLMKLRAELQQTK